MASLMRKALGKLNARLKLQFFDSSYKNNIANNAIIYDNVKFINKKDLYVGEFTEIKDYVIIQSFGRVEIGRYCQINPFTVIYAGEVFIGDYVMIAPHCMISSGNHDYKQTEVPMRLAGNLSKGPIIIEDDVWIGANVTVTDGVRIGKGSVIAANSCVNKDIPNYSIAAGVPAKVIGSRK